MKRLMTVIRMVALAAVGLTAVAIGIGLAREQPEEIRVPELRTLMHVPRDEMASMLAGATWFVDPSVGRLEPLRLPEGDQLDLASVSPWRDEQGSRQVVGRWSHLGTSGSRSSKVRGSGLARFSFPGGKPLDYLTMELVPLGPPAWVPGAEARVVFTAADGVIYTVSFEREGRPGHPSRTPVALAASPDLPWAGRVIFGNLCWPDDPRFADRLIVALRHRNTPDTRFSAPEIWWLKLDPAGLQIVDAGRVTTPDPAVVNEQLPAVGAAADGSLRLAFLTGSDERSWELAVASLDFDPITGLPHADRPEIVAEDCFYSRPAFSADASWISCVVHGQQTDLLPHRVALLLPHRVALDPAPPAANAFAVNLPGQDPAP